MLALRRIDWIAQAVIAVITLILLVTITWFLVGELLLGVWQVISAILNTYQMSKTQYSKRIAWYWILVVVSLGLLATGDGLLQSISIVGSWGIAIFYWITYRSFIKYLAHRGELATVVRNK